MKKVGQSNICPFSAYSFSKLSDYYVAERQKTLAFVLPSPTNI